MQYAGIYIHIPFCRSRCSYCDFATGIYDTQIARRYVAAVCHEFHRWSEVNAPVPVDTIYFGGGTPSLLNPEQVAQILTAVHHRFYVSADSEITMEMNPGSAGGSKDQTEAQLVNTLSQFRSLGVNRVSFGAQTFADNELARLGRAHNAADITTTYQNLRTAGFDNISVDLIAGLPGQTIEGWKRNVEMALAFRPQHLSFYLLEVHSGTPLAEHIKRGIQPEPDEDLAAEMYELMLDHAVAAGYEHYEISNLALPGFESKHNSKYWTAQPYYGFGCSAHSYDGRTRRWSNERDVSRYVELIENNRAPTVERQELSAREIESEAAFLGLRMMRGVAADGIDVAAHANEIERFREAGLIEIQGDVIKLTRAGALLSNEVFAAFL